MRRLESEIAVDPQRLTRDTELCVRECVSKYHVFDSSFPHHKHFRTQSLVRDYGKRLESKNSVLTLITIRAYLTT